MMENGGPRAIVDAGVEGGVPARQVPSYDFLLTNKNDSAPGHPQTVDLHTHVGDPPRFTGLEVNDRDRVLLPPCERCELLVCGKTQGECMVTAILGRYAGEGEVLISCVPLMNFRMEDCDD